MRSEFEKLSDVSIIFDRLHPTIIWFCETSNQYVTSFSGFDNKVVWLNGAWYAYQEQQNKIDDIKSRIQDIWTNLDARQSKDYIIESCEDIIQELLK